MKTAWSLPCEYLPFSRSIFIEINANFLSFIAVAARFSVARTMSTTNQLTVKTALSRKPTKDVLHSHLDDFSPRRRRKRSRSKTRKR